MQRNIRRMEARPETPSRKRVAAYARVSCGNEEMLHSLMQQVDYYSSLIQSNPAWIYVGVYADEGIPGTTANRDEFQRLMGDCRAGKIDMILTKSISRFGRNTVILLESVRELRTLGVDVYFERENIHSAESAGELMLTILSSMAQEESRSVSENQKWRIRSAYRQGEPMNWRFMFGYTIRRGEIRINEGEAKIVREIFIRVLEGESFGSICRDLNKRGIPRTLGGTWSPAHMRELLRNEKYAGNALLQKRYVNNHLEKKLVRNNGELPQYFVEESHPAIVSKETFDAVQKRLQQIDIALSGRKKPQRSELSGKMRCPRCGKPYRRVTSNGSVGWNCSTFVSEGKKGCWGKKIPDDALKAAIAKALALAEYDASSCEERVNCIVPREGNTLEVVLNDGRTGTVTWEERSRAESWTPEMKERARHAAQRKRTCVK